MVDDGSIDGTKEEASRTGAIVISHSQNMGKGSAMRTGVEQSEGSIIVFIDGDGAHNPEDIPCVIEPIIQGKADLVIGSRLLHGSKVPTAPLRRKLSNIVASVIISAIISFILPLVTLFRYTIRRRQITDCTSGFRAITREGWYGLGLKSGGFQVEVEMIYEAVKKELRITEVPISCNWNSQNSHLSIIRDGLRTVKLLSAKLYDDIRRKKGLEGET